MVVWPRGTGRGGEWDYRPNVYGVQGIYTDDTQYCLCGLQSIFETGRFDPRRTAEGTHDVRWHTRGYGIADVLQRLVQCSAACGQARVR
jgi:ADP-ribosylglycohydrolase